MSFVGATVTWQAYTPDTRTPLTAPISAPVSGEAVEFEDIAQYDLPGGSATVNADIDIEANRIVYTVDDTRYSQFAVTSGFNGYVLTDANGSLPPIRSVSLNGETTLGIGLDDIFFNENAIYVNVESLRFSSGDTIILDVSFDVADGQAVAPAAKTTGRLYEACFGREADNAGLNYWAERHDAGIDFLQMANFFIGSAEFQSKFGNPANLSARQFVEQLYLNILDRPGEDAGVSYWVATLDSGSVSSAQALLGFAESVENIQAQTYLDNLSRDLNGDYVIV
jgi:hypothetical protein